MCEIIEFEGKKLKVVSTNKIDNCRGCFFANYPLSACEDLKCGSWQREDKQDVIFVEVKHVWPKYKILFAENSRYNATCGKCDVEECTLGSQTLIQCINLEKSLSPHHGIYFKKVN